jgi:hypothetical protein
MRLPPPRSALLNKNQAATFMSHEAKPENLIGKLPDWLKGALRAHLGDAYYESLIDLIYAPLFVRAFLDAGDTGKL